MVVMVCLQQVTTSLQQSLSAAGRQQLLDSGELGCLAACLTPDGLLQWQDEGKAELLLPLLRVLRNSCAAGATAASLLLQHGVPTRATQLAAALAQQPQQHELQPKLLLASLQLLCNMAVAGGDAAAAVWQQLFPERLQQVLTGTPVAAQEVVALTVLSCLRASPKALSDITAPPAHCVWQQLLAPLLASPASGGLSSSSGSSPADPCGSDQPGCGTAQAAPPHTAAPADSNDNVCLLAYVVAVQLGCLQQLMQCVSPPAPQAANQAACQAVPAAAASASGGQVSQAAAAVAAAGSSSDSTAPAIPACPQQLPGYQPCEQQAVLLHILALEVAAQSQLEQPGRPAGASAAADGAGPAALSPWLTYLVQLLVTLHPLAIKDSQSKGGDNSSGSSSSSPGMAAHVLEAALELLRAIVSREDGGGALLPAGSPGSCLQQLAALGLVQQLLAMMRELGAPPKPRQQQQQQQLASEAARAVMPPYAGFRSDLVAVLGNMLCGQPAIQGEVLASGGIELLLNNCNLDDSAPLAREWALWAVRNMCADNPAAQAYIAQFSAVEAVQSPELAQLGKELQLDRLTNKLQLVDKPQQQPGPAAPSSGQ